MYVHIYRHRPSKMYCTYIQCSFSLTDSYCNPLKFFIRKAADMFKKVAKEDFSNTLYVSKHFLGDERLRGKGLILCLRRPLPWPEAGGCTQFRPHGRALKPG